MNQPLAERLRPKTLDEYIGQKHLVGSGAVLRKMIDAGRVPSFILWGPPGVGKTTLAQIISQKLETPFYTLSAINSGVKDVRDVIEKAKGNRFFNTVSPILFIDEIHRSHNRESFFRSHPAFTVPMPSLCTEIIRERRSSPIITSSHHRRYNIKGKAYSTKGNRCSSSLFRR